MIENRNIKGPIAGFLIGGAIGGIVALLYAPKTGRELRNDIGRKTNELVNDGKKLSGELWTGARTKATDMLESANSLLNTGKEKIVSQTEKVKDAFKAGVDAFSEEKDMMTMNGSTESSSGSTSSSETSGNTRNRRK